MSERLYTLKRGTLSKLAAELDASGRISAERVAAILNESKGRPGRAFADNDLTDETDELYREWAAMSDIPLVTVSAEELERLRADVQAGDEAEDKIASEETERQRALAAVQLSDADADALYERFREWWL